MKKHILFLLITLLASSSLMAQSRVSGTITGKSGEAVIGATVQVQGTTVGTITDVDGNFSFEVPEGSTTLVVSSIGYVTRRIAINGQSNINLVMEEDVTQLDEVVVSALGFKQDKDKLGSTASIVRTDDITRSGEAGIAASLAGKASGVLINQNTGDPGAGTTIKIRGANTIFGSSQPLIILDGVPISNSTIYGGGNNLTGGVTGGTVSQTRLNDLNQEDIESVTVLKGASAASLWGSRAANGVIVITTKKGKAGKPSISYKLTQSWDVVHERLEMQSTYGQGTNGNYSNSIAESWGDYIPDRSGEEDVYDLSGGFFTARDGSVHYPIISKNSRETFVDENWDAAFQTGGFTRHDLSINGGKDDATYFMSVSRMDQDGIIKESFYDRTNLRLNSNFVMNDWLTVSGKSSYTSIKNNRIQQNSNTTGLLLGLLRTAPDFDTRDYIGTYTDASGSVANSHRAYRNHIGSSTPAYNNPLWTLYEQSAISQVERFTVSTEAQITPNSWLNFIVRPGADIYTDTREWFFPVYSAGSRSNGNYAEDVISERQLNIDFIGRANTDITTDISLTTTLGYNINDRQRNTTQAQVLGFLANVRKKTADLNSASEASTYNNIKTFQRSNRAYAIFAFDMFDQLNFTASGSLESASSIADTYFYPSFDAAWRLSEVVDLGSTPINFVKLRASWGQVGVQPSPHRAQTLAEGGFSYGSYNSVLDIAYHGGGFRLDDDLGNAFLEPEIKTEWEIGTDIRAFSERMSLSMTYYQNNIDGILMPVDLTPSSGFDTQYANAAEMENKGFEVDLAYDIIQSTDWNFSTTVNWSRNRNKVLDIEGNESLDMSGGSVSSRAVVGYQLGALWGTGSLKNEDGSFDLDVNGFPQLTPGQGVLGDPNPDWRAGIGLNASYKNFSVNALIEHSHGGKFSPRTQWVLRRFGTTAETANTITLDQNLINYDGEVIMAGTTVRGNVHNFGGGPVLLDETWYRHGIGGGFGDSQAYNFSIKDAQYTRLRELSVTYSLAGNDFLEKAKIERLTFTFTGRNLILWDKLEGVDPQVNQSGVGNDLGLDYFTNPTTKSYLFTVGINF